MTCGAEYKILLRDTTTGKEVEVVETCAGEPHEGTNHFIIHGFLWEEGNLGCDCSRGAYFHVKVPCGSTRFVIVSVEGSAYTEVENG